ncbi:MAG: TIGR03936 family radical SAM-associated protein [Clostridia bacterium]|nr:TIGR03936 family radical SAM-associated protein [Oscillospiraceae bacterium]MDY5627784.1 TIGR03936 family radical SAM-associated protein [Clostridia bacterium]
MSKYRIKYKKTDAARYISHLDFIRTITRTFRRAELPVKYSQGFNPHMILTVALPISVGVISDAEYMEVELNEEISEDKIISALNQNIPLGLEITAAKKVCGEDIALNKISYAKYFVEVEHSGECDIEKLLQNETLMVDKKSKKGITLTDIKPMIAHLGFIGENNGNAEYEMILSAGNVQNLKPETVIAAFEKYGDNYKADFISVTRKEMYFEDFKSVM